MTLFEKIIAAFPELENSQNFVNGTIVLRNDSDGTEDYISKWEYSKPIPESLTAYDRS